MPRQPDHHLAVGAAVRLAALAVLLAPAAALADDRAEATTTWYQEKRRGGAGGLTVINPQLDAAVDLGEHVELSLGYGADVVSGATASVFAVDAVSSATTFSDTRHEAQLGLGLSGSRSRLSLSAGGGRERDYLSLNLGAAASVNLPGKNTTLAVSFNHGFDQVCDRDNAMATPLERRPLSGLDPCDKDWKGGVDRQGELGLPITVWRDLSLDTAQATLSQNVSPTLVIQSGLYGQVLRGFQANPYRRVRVAGIEAQESLPDVRGRLALFVRGNKFLEKVNGAVHGELRGYSDTWGVDSLTAEMAYSQYLGDSLLVRLRGRLYQQSEATFFKDAFFYDTEGPAGAYFTGDRELAPIRNVVTGVRLSYLRVATEGDAFLDELQLNLKLDVLFLDELPANPPSANTAGIGDQFLSSGQAVDGFVLQLGLLDPDVTGCGGLLASRILGILDRVEPPDEALARLMASLRGVLSGHPEVRLAVLFGSRATGRARPDSDVDVGLLPAGDPPLAVELALQADLERAVGHPVNLVRLDTAPTLVRWYAARDGIPIASSSPVAWPRFRAAASIEHGDFAPALEEAARRYRVALTRRPS